MTLPLASMILWISLLSNSDRIVAPTTQGWSDRGMFFFGSGTVIDFQKQRLGFGAVVFDLEDCSDALNYCAKSDRLSVVVPKSCSRASQPVFQTNGVITRALGSESRIIGHPAPPEPTRLTLLVTDGQPWVVFEYVPEGGIVAMTVDFSRQTDFREEVRLGTYRSERPPTKSNAIQHVKRRSFDPMGACDYP